jgi:hypothetical protein
MTKASSSNACGVCKFDSAAHRRFWSRPRQWVSLVCRSPAGNLLGFCCQQPSSASGKPAWLLSTLLRCLVPRPWTPLPARRTPMDPTRGAARYGAQQPDPRPDGDDPARIRCGLQSDNTAAAISLRLPSERREAARRCYTWPSHGRLRPRPPSPFGWPRPTHRMRQLPAGWSAPRPPVRSGLGERSARRHARR